MIIKSCYFGFITSVTEKQSTKHDPKTTLYYSRQLITQTFQYFRHTSQLIRRPHEQCTLTSNTSRCLLDSWCFTLISVMSSHDAEDNIFHLHFLQVHVMRRHMLIVRATRVHCAWAHVTFAHAPPHRYSPFLGAKWGPTQVTHSCFPPLVSSATHVYFSALGAVTRHRWHTVMLNRVWKQRATSISSGNRSDNDDINSSNRFCSDPVPCYTPQLR